MKIPPVPGGREPLLRARDGKFKAKKAVRTDPVAFSLTCCPKQEPCCVVKSSQTVFSLSKRHKTVCCHFFEPPMRMKLPCDCFSSITCLTSCNTRLARKNPEEKKHLPPPHPLLFNIPKLFILLQKKANIRLSSKASNTAFSQLTTTADNH